MGLLFEWDINKAKSNAQKHNVSFEEAATVFGDENSLTIDDADHSTNEKRKITMGRSANNHLIVVVHTDRGSHIRIISARRASRKERLQYER
jgi:uncharacterized DUF497 family protein